MARKGCIAARRRIAFASGVACHTAHPSRTEREHVHQAADWKPVRAHGYFKTSVCGVQPAPTPHPWWSCVCAGFENFERNDWEQLCINYANERLQFLFVQETVIQQQREYESEGVPIANIEFPDNSAQIALFEDRGGMLDLLNEECILPGGSEEQYVGKLHKLYAKSPIFGKAKLPTAIRDPAKRRGGPRVGGRTFSAHL